MPRPDLLELTMKTARSAAAVALGDDEPEAVVQAHVDGRAVGLADLDLPRRAVLGVALDGVRVPAGQVVERRRVGGVGAGAGRAALTVAAAHRVGDPDAAEGQRKRGAAGEDR